MNSILDVRLIEVGYFLSRLGTKNPPEQLHAESWKDAYSKFYGTFGRNKTEDEFKNSLKNLRDHFDSHLTNNRTGWLNAEGLPQQLSKANKQVLDRLNNLTDDKLWQEIRPLVTISYSSVLNKKKAREVEDAGGKYFSSEFSGNKSITPTETNAATVTHGFIVDSLKCFVEENFENNLVYNTQKIDLAIEHNGTLTTIFEVKTSTDTQSIYTAVGQLFMHSAGLPTLEKYIVLPKPFENTTTLDCLASLDVKIIWYSSNLHDCQFSFH